MFFFNEGFPNTSRSSQESVLQPQSDPYIKSETSIKIPLFTAKAAPKVLMYVSQLGNPSKKSVEFSTLGPTPPPSPPPMAKSAENFRDFFFKRGTPQKTWSKMA